MVRVARDKSKTGIYHIMLRGINRQIIFEDAEDNKKFLEMLNFYKQYKESHRYNVYGYCLMSNHVHILLQEVDDDIATAIKRICASYVYWYNTKYDRCGHLFQERFKSEVVESESYFVTVLRYIHQNPIKARLVKRIKDYPWSSYNEYVIKVDIINTDLGLNIFSSGREKGIELFINYHEEDNSDKCLDYETFIKLTDNEVRQLIKGLGIESISELQHLEKSKRDFILRKLKRIDGVSLRQLSRLTGISKSVIHRS
ncbi:MAG: transposase [Firmicutes bacterium]|nr:transposase [Bacillota bacterium]